MAAIAGPLPPTSGVPVREGVAVTASMTPDFIGIMCFAAERAVRKYDLV
jgi:hypothetical protein